MKRFGIQLVCVIVLFALHSVVRYHTASLFLLPVSISIFIATATALPAMSILLIALLAELFSALPQGSMLLVFFIPFFTRYFMPWAVPNASWKFFAYVGITVTLQIIALVAIHTIGPDMRSTALPISIALLQIFGTSVSTYIVSIIYYELRHH